MLKINNRTFFLPRLTLTMSVAHPYYPRSLEIPNYVPPIHSQSDILTVFFFAIAVLLLASYLIISQSPITKANKFVFLWFVFTACIHTFVEGWVVVFNQTVAGRNDFMSDLWKEYANADSRYLVSDPAVFLIEGITGVKKRIKKLNRFKNYDSSFGDL